jgi:hypothetical protein
VVGGVNFNNDRPAAVFAYDLVANNLGQRIGQELAREIGAADAAIEGADRYIARTQRELQVSIAPHAPAGAFVAFKFIGGALKGAVRLVFGG